ncbi:MAG: hypothetical protein Ta2B_17280 [Termitinemataceae bacterium]|nr:MAG: hypothetical protein Ta2B_17280 [Termitinemataceae bacterium]
MAINKINQMPPKGIPVITDLDMLPFPDREGLEFEKLAKMNDPKNFNVINPFNIGTISMSRSCQYNCTFCFHPTGSKYRRRSKDIVLKEVDYLIAQFGIRQLWFFDEMFASKSNIHELFELCDELVKRRVYWCAEMRVDDVDMNILRKMKDSNCVGLLFGVESAVNKILKSMRKNTTIEQIENAFHSCSILDLPAIGFLIFGDLEDDKTTIRESANWKFRHPNYKILLQMLSTFPGSHDYNLACERGLIPDRTRYLKNGEFDINISKLSDVEYSELKAKIAVIDDFAKFPVDFDFDNIVPAKYKDILENLTLQGKVAVWPATNNVMRLIEAIGWSNYTAHSDNVFFVNQNTADIFTDRIRAQVNIYSPNIIKEQNIETVVCLSKKQYVIDSVLAECSKKYSFVKKVLTLSDFIQG